MKRFVIIYYLITLVSLLIYSYSQIDLNLTLSSNQLYQVFQKNLIQLGYFNRPLSTLIYIIILFSLFLTYLLLLKMIKNKKFKNKEIFILIIISGIILFFAYCAFSHDLFNYMFDARILTKYGLNPYQYKALDFPNDLWTRFMHWTHRTYPYGPLWIILTAPFSFLGIQKFTLTLFFFKLLFLGTYFSSGYLIYLISKTIDKSKTVLALSFFAFNPLILIETLVSPHNDSVMLVLALLSIYLLIRNKIISSTIIMLFSAAIKFVTAPLLLINLYYFLRKSANQKQDFQHSIFIMWIIYLISIIPVILSRELLPWYAVPFVGLAALISTNKFVSILSLVISFGMLLKYISFLYQGEWLTSSYEAYVTVLLILIVLACFYYFLESRGDIIKLKYESKKIIE